MSLATLDDLRALGALAANTAPSSPTEDRAYRLLELASAQVCLYLRTDEDTIGADTDTWTETKLTVLAVVTAEVAARRMNVSAAPSSDPYGPPDGMLTLKLNRNDMRTLDRLIGRGGRGSQSVEVERDTNTSYLTYSDAGRQGDWRPNEANFE